MLIIIVPQGTLLVIDHAHHHASGRHITIEYLEIMLITIAPEGTRSIISINHAHHYRAGTVTISNID